MAVFYSLISYIYIHELMIANNKANISRQVWIPLDISLTVVFGFYFTAYWYYEEYICEEEDEENTPGNKPHKHTHMSGYSGTQR